MFYIVIYFINGFIELLIKWVYFFPDSVSEVLSEAKQLWVFIYQMERIRQLGSHPNLMWIVCAVPFPLVLQQLLNPAVLPIAGWQETEASSRKWLVADGSSHWNAMPQTFIYPDELGHYKMCFHTLLLLSLQFICSVGNS